MRRCRMLGALAACVLTTVALSAQGNRPAGDELVATIDGIGALTHTAVAEQNAGTPGYSSR